MEKLQIAWFKRDLRTSDHWPPVETARGGRIRPLFAVRPELWAEPDMSGRQRAFAALRL